MIGWKLRLNVNSGVSAGCRYLSSKLNALDHMERLDGGLSQLPSKATVVICGGGVMGAAVAYHLARRGWGGKTVVIEKERVGSGSRWHSSGLVGAFKPTLAQVHLAQSSIQLLKDLEARGRPTGWKQCGSLLIARTRDRMTVYRRMKSQSVSSNNEQKHSENNDHKDRECNDQKDFEGNDRKDKGDDHNDREGRKIEGKVQKDREGNDHKDMEGNDQKDRKGWKANTIVPPWLIDDDDSSRNSDEEDCDFKRIKLTPDTNHTLQKPKSRRRRVKEILRTLEGRKSGTDDSDDSEDIAAHFSSSTSSSTSVAPWSSNERRYFILWRYQSWGISCELISPRRCQELSPLISVEDVIGGLWIPGDGVGDPHLIGISLMREAVEQGVGVMEDCAITAVLSRDEKVCGVETTHGAIECNYFVNCAGFWARQIGQMSSPQVKVPLLPCEHYYLHTKTIAGLDPMTPVIRDPDGYIYLRERDGCILAGGFEPVAKPVFEEEIANTAQRCVAEDWDHFHVLLQQLLKRVPSLRKAVLHKLCNGLEAFSPDCKWIVGEAPEMMNYHVAAGMKTVGISAAGGVAEATADEIIDGYSKYDMYELGINRFLGLHNNKRFLRDRVKEVPGVHYGMPYPFPEFETGRNLRLSPIYPTLREKGAVFGQVMGYERPTWFESVENKPDDSKLRPFKIAYTKSFGKPHWFDIVQREYWACRESVGLADYSSFTKIDLQSQGREVVDFLQYLCSNDVDVPVGGIIHTGMQNERGGYENDCSLARISENHYMMIAPTIQQTRCKSWMKRHLPQNGSVTLSDVTSMYTAICVMGPFTRNLLSELTDTDLAPSNFPFFTFKEIDVGLANGIRAMNLTHTGELGYVLYIPNEFALHVYNRLMTEGQKFGITHVGYYASRALRVEKFFAFWGQDLDTMTTPLECGRTWRVKFHKEIPFIGREALLRQRDEGVRRHYVQLLLTDHDHELDLWSWGGEPIYRDGNYCGQTTTTSYGFTFKKQVCLGFVDNLDENGVPQKITHEYVLGGHYEIDIAGIRYAAKVNLHSPNLPTKYPDKERDVYQATRKPHESQYLGRHYQP